MLEQCSRTAPSNGRPAAAGSPSGGRRSRCTSGTMNRTEVLTGSCLCGAVSFEVRSPFLRFTYCHCSRCRKASGSGHSTNLYCAPERFSWLAGEELTVRYDLPSARSFSAVFCGRCGAPLPHHTRSGREVIVPAGSLDTQPRQPPSASIYCAYAVPWSVQNESVPRFAEAPDSQP